MSGTFSKAIFGVGVVLALAAFISIYVTSIAQNNQKLQGTPVSNTVAQPSGVSTAITTNQSSGNAGNAVSSITIAEGSAAQQVKVYYQPDPAGVVSGSKITWTNKDIAPHTATASDFSFDTGVIPVGSSGSAIVKGQGNIAYRCTIHPWMTGTIQTTGSNQTQDGGALNTTASTALSQGTRANTAPTVNDTTQNNQKLQGTPVSNTVAQPSGVSTAITTNQSSGNAGNAVSSITIAEGSAAQQVRVYYQPNPAGVVSGSKITWTNKDIAPHTATSGLSSSAADSGKIFDTGLISPGSAGSAVVSGNGKIPYHCTFHPWMTGVTQISTSNQTQAGGSLQNNASTDPSQPTRTITVPTVNDSNLKVVQVISNLSMPTTMAFLGPDDFLMLQKGGTVFRVTNGTISSHPLLNVTVGTGITQGMLGVAISKNPEFNATYVFLYYTEALNNQTNGQNQTSVFEPLENRLYRYDLVNGQLVNPKLLTVLPAKQGFMDNGGYLRIGPDNNIYFSVGAITASDVSAVQTLTQNFVNGTPVDGRAGILRITQDGDPVLDKGGHGLLGDSSPLNLYYGYGLKDSFGIDFDPLTGNLWDAEPGRIINDEINLIEPGFNGGFEALQGPSTFVPAAPADLVYFNGTGKYRDPEFVWTQKVVPVGLKFLTSNKLGEKYENDIFLGSFLNGKIYHFDLNENRNHLIIPAPFVYKQMATWNSTGSEDITFGDGFGGISSLNVGPDGYLYVISFINGAIYKIMPAQ